MSELVTGIQILMAVIFLVTGVTKFRFSAETEVTLVGLAGSKFFERSPLNSRQSARLLASYEVALAALVAWGRPSFVNVVLFLTMVVFVAVVVRAWRLHVSCGCFPDRRSSEHGSIARTSWLAALSGILAFSPQVSLSETGIPSAIAIAAILGFITWAVYTLVAWLSGGTGTTDSPAMVPVIMANQISEVFGGRQMPERSEVEWVPMAQAARETGVPVSIMMAKLMDLNRSPVEPLPIGSQVDFRLQTIRSEVIDTASLGGALVIAIFSTTCDRCPTHIPAVRAAFERLAPEDSLVILAGPDAGAPRFVEAFGEVSRIARVDYEHALIQEFKIRDFPVFYRVTPGGGVDDAASHIDDLNWGS